ncbi:MAG: tetratricopeptide repeat protein [bacterium]|nr:tetratricopeptide repeat protein [bacterium]
MLLFCLILSLDSLLVQGIKLSYEERYDEAEAVFFKVRDKYPDDPAPYFFLSSLYVAYMTDFGTDSLEDTFIAYIDTTLDKATCILKRQEDAWAYAWKGGGLIDRAYYKYEKGDILGMLEDGVRAVREFNSALAIDPYIYDAYIGISIYEYINYRIKKAIPFIGDNNSWRQSLEIASDSACFLRVAAKNTLALLLIEESDWDEAITILQELLKEYPDSRTFTWTLAKAYFGKEDWRNAEAVYKRLIHLIKTGQPDAPYPLVFALDRLAEIYFLAGEYDKCRIEASRMLDITEGLGDRYNEFRKKAKKYLTK